MNELDIFILAVYLITVAYILYQAIAALDDQTKIWLDKDELSQALEKRGLKDQIEIDLKFEKRYLLNKDADKDKQPKELTVNIKNKSDEPIYVDWDRSTLTDLGGRSRRVIRMSPSGRLELSQPQVLSVVGPNQSLSEKITAEDLLERNKETELYEVKKPLIDIQGLAKNKDKKKLYKEFMEEAATLDYALCLAIMAPDFNDVSRGDRRHLVRCKIYVKKLPWQYILPWQT
jgi:hypothetical protein